MFYEKNLKLITQKFPYLLPELGRETTKEQIAVEASKSKTGLPVVRVSAADRKVFMNSAYDPVIEARRWAAKLAEGNSTCLLIIGSGFLYHLQALLELNHFKKIIMYEPCMAIFRACMQEVDLEFLTEVKNFLWLAGENHDVNVERAIQFLGTDYGLINDLEVKFLPYYPELFAAQIGVFQTRFQELVKIIYFNFITGRSFVEAWLENGFKNLKLAVNSPFVKHFLGRFSGVPAFIVGAGPSLARNIHLLKDIKGKALIICAGSSIRAMKRFGVDPHFLLMIDFGDINNKIYNDLDLSDIYFCYNFRAHHDVIANTKANRVFMKTSSERLPDLLMTQDTHLEIGDVASGFSISHTCLDFATKLGCNPIVLMGQDLSYTDNKRYAETTEHQEYVDVKNLPPGFFLAKDIYGRDVITSPEFDSFRLVFERLAEYNAGKVTLINATEAGLPIKGIPNRKLAEVIAEYCREERDIETRLKSLYENGLKALTAQPVNPQKSLLKVRDLANRGISKLIDLADQLQGLRKLVFSNTEYPVSHFDPILNKITTAYDEALKAKEYHMLLHDLQHTTLSVNKIKALEADKTEKEAYDTKLQGYLNVILETKKYLELIERCAQDALNVEPVQSASPIKSNRGLQELDTLEAKIKRGQELNKVKREIEFYLSKSPEAEGRSRYLYLYGLYWFKTNQLQQAQEFFEQAVHSDQSDYKTLLALAKLYYKKQNVAKALECLHKCRELGFQKSFCWKRLIRIQYLTKDYVAANNLISEHLDEFISKLFYRIMKVECLAELNLRHEATREYQNLIQKYRVPQSLHGKLADLSARLNQSEYEIRYEANLKFFEQRGITLPDFETARYKVCRFLSGALIYDCQPGLFLPGIGQSGCDLKIWWNDTLLIYNTDNICVFERLQLICQEIKSEFYRGKFSSLPIYVVETNLDQWLLNLQLFDFNQLDSWSNLHFHIGISDEKLMEIFNNEPVLFPNIIYGTDPDHLTELLTKIKDAKVGGYNRYLSALQEYYRSTASKQLERILIVTTITDNSLLYYGQMLEDYLRRKGYNSRLHTENNQYYRFTIFDDVKLLNEFRPDLVIHLFAVQEELDVFKELNLPFVSWLMNEKEPLKLKASCPKEQIWVTGNLNIVKDLYDNGFRSDQINSVLLPVVPVEAKVELENNQAEADIGIIDNLDNLDDVFFNLGATIYDLLNRPAFSLDKIETILKTVYFMINTEQLQDELRLPGLATYEKLLMENFARFGQVIEQATLQFVARVVKQELENLIYKILQARWVVNDLTAYRIAIHGNGWWENETFKPFWRGKVDFVKDPASYTRTILGNKINLYIGNQFNNNSYLQPDLIQGLAAGGFFLVNDLLVKECGPSVLEPFGGLLETYGCKAELIEKLNYFITNEAQRIERASQLQTYIQAHFNIQKVINVLNSIYYTKRGLAIEFK